MKIYKYPLELVVEQTITGNIVSLLTVQEQHGKPTIWALVHDLAALVEYKIQTVGTGFDKVEMNYKYIGTIQKDGMVWHYFESGRRLI